ncbi:MULTISPECIES: hypothetical protein [unclassified Streptomyces]|uniref:hypothetical protein n=1 Tax=unclassified Streptomyces TaxID=2593676 RepID=UPI0033B57646
MRDELCFEPPVGAITISHRDKGLALLKGLGAHALRLELEVRLPAAAEAGRVLTLETDPHAPPVAVRCCGWGRPP